ncbi:MAG: HAMP domain-containing protein [Acidobacteria bacterium]|nr:HAMP domain-containing protein [Acidobacteriota bacterium]
MSDQLGVPLHFAAEFLILAVCVATAMDSVRRSRSGGGTAALGRAAGFGLIAVAQVLHGVLIVGSDGAWPLVALRFSGIAITAVCLRGGEAKALGAALGALLAGEVVLIVAPGERGAWLLASHALRASAAVPLARSIRGSVARSVRVRFVAGFVGALLIVVLVVSLGLNQVISTNLERQELERLQLAGDAQVTQLVDRGASAQEFASAVADNQLVQDYFKSNPRLLPRAARLLLAGFTREVGFMLFADREGRVLGSAEGAPAASLSRAQQLALAGTDVVGEVLRLGRPVSSPDSVAGTQVVVIGAAPVRSRGKVIGAVALGMRVDSGTLRRLAADSGSSVSLLVQGRVAASTLGPARSLAGAFRAIEGEIRRVRSDGVSATTSVGVGGERYLTALVPIGRSDDQVVGILAFSRPARILATAQEPIDRTLFLIALAAAVIASALAWMWGGRVTRPISSLTRAARELRRGNLEARAAVESGDEVGLLGASFNEMAESLGRMTGDLRAAADQETALRNRTEAIMQSMGDGLVATDAAGQIMLFNKAAEAMVGVRASRATGRPLGEVLAGHAAGRPLADAALAGSPAEAVLERPDGSTLVVAIVSEPLLDADGTAVGRVIVFRDVSREREAERMKTEFLANVSHELRTPLTPIKGYADLLKRKAVPRERMIRFLDGILESSVRLERVVDILVDVAAIEAGRLRPRLEPSEPRALVDAAVERWRERDAGHRFARRVPAGIPPVAADPKMIARCLDELIENAVKFSSGGGRIEVRADEVPGGARRSRPAAVAISVRDEGIGIAPDKMPSLFEDFRQLDGSETRSVGGLGLGLAYVRRIAAVHGGRVLAESTPGRGSTFSIVLPVADTRKGAAPGSLRSVAADRGARSRRGRVVKVVRRAAARAGGRPGRAR